MTDIARVRGVIEAATPGPWHRHTYGHRNIRAAAGQVTRALFMPPVSADVRLLMTDLSWVHPDDETTAIAMAGNGPTSVENADAIALTHNLAPLWLALWEAAGREHVRMSGGDPFGHLPDVCDTCGRLWPCPEGAALDALAAKAKEELG